MSPRLHRLIRAVAVAAVLAIAPPCAGLRPGCRSRVAHPAAGEPAAPGHRPERGTAVPQPPARGAAAPARRGASGAPGAQPPGAAERRGRAAGAANPATGSRRLSAAGRLPATRRYRAAGAAGHPYEQPQIAAPAPIMQEPGVPRPATVAAAMPSIPRRIRTRPAHRRRSAAARCRSPTRPRSARPAVVAPASRSTSAGTSPRAPAAGVPPAPGRPTAALTTLPPSATPRDEFDLGIGYMQRKDYALAEETMKNFAQKYPNDPLIGEFEILARRKLFPAPAISRRGGGLPRRDHQIRQVRRRLPTRCCGSASRWRR